jgi:hypothetical protein
LQQHFSQQQDSPQQSQQDAAAAAVVARADLLALNGNTARKMDESFMVQG